MDCLLVFLTDVYLINIWWRKCKFCSTDWRLISTWSCWRSRRIRSWDNWLRMMEEVHFHLKFKSIFAMFIIIDQHENLRTSIVKMWKCESKYEIKYFAIVNIIPERIPFHFQLIVVYLHWPFPVSVDNDVPFYICLWAFYFTVVLYCTHVHCMCSTHTSDIHHIQKGHPADITWYLTVC